MSHRYKGAEVEQQGDQCSHAGLNKKETQSETKGRG